MQTGRYRARREGTDGKTSFGNNIYYVKFLLEYNSYSPSKKKFEVGDVVVITYWYLMEEDCPPALWKKIPTVRARIVEIVSNQRVRVSYDVDGSPLKGAPDSVIKKSKILSNKGSDTPSPSSASSL